MFPRLIQYHDFFIPSYGVLVSTGLFVGLIVASKLAVREEIDPDDAWTLGVVVILAGLIGAKILYILNDWNYYSTHLREIFSIGTLQAGGVFSGGIVGALIVGVWYIRKHRMPVLATVDVYAPGVAIGHAFGRLGCFAAGCCWGRETTVPWAVTFHDSFAQQYVGTPLGIPLHPTQIYEFIVELCNFFLLLALYRRKSFDGQIMGTYMIVYGTARYFIEFFRGDPGRGQFVAFITATQALAIGMVVFGGLLWVKRTPLRVPRTPSRAGA